MSSKDLNLVVTLGGRPVPDQKLGIRAFKDACLAASKTPPPQAGEWTLTAPDGRTWKADSPLKCCGLEQRERVPANVALARIVEEMERFDAEEAAKAASAPETLADRQREPDAVEKQALYGNLRKLYRRDVPDETLDRSKPEVPAASTWRCTVCNNVNPDDASHCRQCGWERVPTPNR